ncbi:MAG TPA: hypothetical protein DHN33_11410 [Eubacteriaceae bacterium]|nr:hypothetical protein [Eubacteriaceae bacterium]
MEKLIGKTGEAKIIVEKEHTAKCVKSGDLEVFATPMMIALMEEAACNLIQKGLKAGETTVGVQIDVKHIAPTPIGNEARAKATLLEADGKKLTFEVEASDGKGVIGKGRHKRMVVDQERFLKNAIK